jgi:hypothetical protein
MDPNSSEEAYQRIAQLEHMLQDATQTIGNLRSQAASAQNNPTTVTVPTTSVVRARAPDAFDGKDISLAPGFLQALEQYLNLVNFTTPADKLAMAITYFRLPAQLWVLGACRNGKIKTFEDLCEHFRSVYAIDVDKELEISLDKLTTLRQGDTQSVSEHYANFLALSYASGASEDASCAQLFFQSLKFPLRRAMLKDSNLKRGDIKSVLASAIRHERAFLAGKSIVDLPATPRRSPFASHPHVAPSPPVMNRLGPRVGGPSPMDLDAVQTDSRRPRLSMEERQRRMDQRLCIVCGDPNHFRDSCPFSTFRRPRAANLSAMSVSTPSTTSMSPSPSFPPMENRNNPEQGETPALPSAALACIDMTTWDSEENDFGDFGDLDAAD